MTWVVVNDKNTKFFHGHVSRKNKKNDIWGLWDEDGKYIFAQPELEQVAINFFRNQFRERDRTFLDQRVF